MDIHQLAEICHEYNKNFDTKSDLSNSRFEDYLKNSAPYRHIKQSLISKNITLHTNDPSIFYLGGLTTFCLKQFDTNAFQKCTYI